ncbi:hypothetical protein ElyMa_003415800 [Elysia marginata]|uniref:Uncharacterized protein n=1 Tax=Elysia marginata TaxID=1093978 RepID=A0AAV4JR43_9GAST|nr:hypothetical protein ElyMa_003415800 [Elysia marginata]
MTSRALPANQQANSGGDDGIEANTPACRRSAANETSLAGKALYYVDYEDTKLGQSQPPVVTYTCGPLFCRLVYP